MATKTLRKGRHWRFGSRYELRYEPWPDRWPRVPPGVAGWLWRGLIGHFAYYNIVRDDFSHVLIAVPFHIVIHHCHSERSIRKDRRVPSMIYADSSKQVD